MVVGIMVISAGTYLVCDTIVKEAKKEGNTFLANAGNVVKYISGGGIVGTGIAGTGIAGTGIVGSSINASTSDSDRQWRWNGWKTLIGAATHGPVAAAFTFDCWKPVLHDESTEPSDGMLLRDLVADDRIKSVTVDYGASALPEIVMQNVWGEEFLVEYVILPSTLMAGHAKRIN